MRFHSVADSINNEQNTNHNALYLEFLLEFRSWSIFRCTASALYIGPDIDSFAIIACVPWYGGMSDGGASAMELEWGHDNDLFSDDKAFATGWVGKARCKLRHCRSWRWSFHMISVILPLVHDVGSRSIHSVVTGLRMYCIITLMSSPWWCTITHCLWRH